MCDFGSDIDEALVEPDYRMDMHTAASVGDLDYLIKTDLDIQVDLDRVNSSSWTCLMYACYYDHGSVAAFLLDRGV